MTLCLPPLFHWSRTENRDKISRRGLVPSTLAARFILVDEDEEPPQLCHRITTVEAVEQDAVCLAATPHDGWTLSGAIDGKPGESWDLYQVGLDDDDDVILRDPSGPHWDEVRVFNRIPKRRVWLVASRVVSKNERRKL